MIYRKLFLLKKSEGQSATVFCDRQLHIATIEVYTRFGLSSSSIGTSFAGSFTARVRASDQSVQGGVGGWSEQVLKMILNRADVNQ